MVSRFGFGCASNSSVAAKALGFQALVGEGALAVRPSIRQQAA